MAATIAQAVNAAASAPESSSHMYAAAVDVTGDTSYPTGGYAVTPATYLPTGARLITVVPLMTGGGFVPQWDNTNSKIKLFSSNGAAPAALAEVANTTNVTTAVIRLTFIYEVV